MVKPKLMHGGYDYNYKEGEDIMFFLKKRFPYYPANAAQGLPALPVVDPEMKLLDHKQRVLAFGEYVSKYVLDETYRAGFSDALTDIEEDENKRYDDCYTNFDYTLPYPICWFRSMCVILFFDQTFRNNILLMSDALKQHSDDGVGNKLLFALRRFVYKTAYYFGVKMLYKLQDTNWNWESNKHLALMYMRHEVLPSTVGNTLTYSTEDHWLFFIALLHAYKPDLFYVKGIEGGLGNKYACNFFAHVMPEIAPDIPKCVIHKMKFHTGLVKTFKFKDKFPPYVVLHYDEFLGWNSTHADLAMFVRVEDKDKGIHKSYTLSSLLVTTYYTLKWWRQKPRCSHQFSIFKCNRKFYTFEPKMYMHTKISREVPLFKYMFGNKGMFPDLTFWEFDYHLNKSIRLGMYTRSMCLFTEKELLLLKELSEAVVKRDWLTVMAALSYFTKSIKITLQRRPEKSLLGRTKVQPIDTSTTYKFWNHIDEYSTDSLRLMFFMIDQTPVISEKKRRVVLGQKNLGSHINFVDKETDIIKDAWLQCMNTTDPNQILLVSPIKGMLNSQYDLKCESFTARNAIQTETLLGVLEALNAFVGKSDDAVGGAPNQKYIKMKKTKKTYKVRKDKHGKEFVIQNKHKTYLSSIKGSYFLEPRRVPPRPPLN